MDYVYDDTKPIQTTYNNGITNTNQFISNLSNIIDRPDQLNSKMQFISQKPTYQDILLEKQFNSLSLKSTKQSPQTNHILPNQSSINIKDNTQVNIPMQFTQAYPIGNTIHSSLQDFNEKLRREFSSEPIVNQSDKNKEQNHSSSALKDIINIMESQKDERMAKSNFLSFLKSLDKGDIVLNESNNTVDIKSNESQDKLNQIWNDISKEVDLTSSIEPKDYYTEALKSIELHDTTKALSLLQAHSLNNPENADCFYHQAQIHMNNGRDDYAIACAKNALNIDYFHLPTYLLLATCYSNEGDEFKSMQQLVSWLKLNSQFNQYYNKTNPLLNLEEVTTQLETNGFNKYSYDSNESLKQMMYKEIANVFNNIYQVNKEKGKSKKDIGDVLLALGICYINLMDYVKAKEIFIEATKYNANDYLAWNRLGAMMNINKEHMKAIEMFNKSLEINPNYPRCYINIGLAYLSMEDYGQSAKNIMKALHLYKDIPEAWNYLITVFSSMENEELVNAAYKRDLSALSTFM